MNTISLNKVAVLGAGVMGAQIAVHFANLGKQVILYDLVSEDAPNALVEGSLKSLTKLQPNPFAVKSAIHLVQAANYQDDLAQLMQCDLVIEAISERFSWKVDLYQKITPYLNEQSVLATNTSGLSIEHLAEVLPDKIRQRFVGMHFFNPPRYMKLVELIPHANTSKEVLHALEGRLTSDVGKGVIIAKDTPNFIGNRIGVFALLTVLHHAEQFQLHPDQVDALTGPLIGRPKSATYRTLDVVGLDTFAHVVQTMHDGLPNDPWHAFFKLPSWIKELVNKGALGSKTKAGIYKKIDGKICVFDIKEGHYRPANTRAAESLKTLLKGKKPQALLLTLKNSELPEARFLWHCYMDLFHYCAYHLDNIAHSMRDVDLAMRWGYGWQQGPFELWNMQGWSLCANDIQQSIQSNKNMVNTPLPEWCGQAPSTLRLYGQSEPHPVYARQYFPDRVYGQAEREITTHFETDAVHYWSVEKNIGVLSFKTKKNTINLAVLEGVQEAIRYAEKDHRALILWQKYDADFSYGANLAEVTTALKEGKRDLVSQTIACFQQTAMALRYAKIPTIAAPRGRVLGGGCELTIHCQQVVAALETYIGLVEVGVGLIPAGGGTKEFAYRASQQAQGHDLNARIQDYFNLIGQATLAQSGLEAKQVGYLQAKDAVVAHQDEILHVAHRYADALSATQYRPPVAQPIKVVGRDGHANILAQLANLCEGQFISDHDYLIGDKLAWVMCGGDLDAGQQVTEDWLLGLELDVFMQLLDTPKTQERIQYTLKNGKPLRN